MSESPENRRERLRVFMARHNLKAKPWARDAGLSGNVLYNFLNGHTDSLNFDTYAKLAASANVPPWEIDSSIVAVPAGGSITAIVGSVSNEWKKDFRDHESQWEMVTVPIPLQFAEITFGLRMSDRSMEKAFPADSILFCVELSAIRRHLKSGDRVIAQRTNDADQVQILCRELRAIGSQNWLWPLSSDQKFQDPILADDSVEIPFLVISRYQPENL